MASTLSSEGHPFAEPTPEAAQSRISDSTLVVGRNASLTIGKDSLIVLDEKLAKRNTSSCCGLFRSKTKSTQAIPFFNVLSAKLSDFDITIHYAYPMSKHVVRASNIIYPIDKNERASVATWIHHLLNRAYGDSQRGKRIKCLINPFGGKGSAQKWYDRDVAPIFIAAGCIVDAERTQYRGHAIEIAEKLDIGAYDVIASCSGDGLPHEVFNGLGKRPDARRALEKVAVVQLPCGSGNAMSWNLYGTESPSMAALCTVKGIITPLDLISITQGTSRTLSFLTQSIGMVAETDLGTDHLRWMGSQRFTYGVLVRLIGKTVYPCDVAVKVEIEGKSTIREHYRQEMKNTAPVESRRGDISSDAKLLSLETRSGLPALKYGTVMDPLPQGWNLVNYDNMGNFYAGNMSLVARSTNFFPATLPNDGCLDLVCIDGDISRLAAIKCMTGAESGKLFMLDTVNYRKVLGYRMIPKGKGNGDGYISIDGESVPFEPFQAEVHRGLGTVLSRSGHMYEAPGVSTMV